MNWITLEKIIKINENKHNCYKFSMSRTIVWWLTKNYCCVKQHLYMINYNN